MNTQLQILLEGYVTLSHTDNINISDIQLDSRLVQNGSLFFAYQGSKVDGKTFIPEALNKGASVVILETKSERVIVERKQNTLFVYMPRLTQQIGVIAARFYNNPSQHLTVIGVTGTNGKTSVTHFIAAALKELDIPCGVIGTLGNGVYGAIKDSDLTTPDPITLQKTLADFVKQGIKFTAMEVSSHSLDQGRVNGINFDIGVFTNLTQDHLDYHKSMEYYGRAKQRLFLDFSLSAAVINADDSFGKKLISSSSKKNVYSYSVKRKDDVLVSIDNLKLDFDGMRAKLFSPWGSGNLYVGLIGSFNISNVLAVFTTLCLLNISFEKALYAMSTLRPVPGRMQKLSEKGKPLVIIDYSHTPDALEKALLALRHHCSGKLYCIFGCGGDRDKGKRSLMAQIAEKLADSVIITDDNPRTEDPKQIFEDILIGFRYPEVIKKIHDRAEAIQSTILDASAEDCILIAGKGAEVYQIIGKEKQKFSDLEQAQIGLGR